MPRERNRLDAAGVKQAQRIVRDIGNTVVGWGMLVWQTAFAAQPSYLLIGAGLLLVGLAPALRVDEMLRSSRDELEEDKR